MDGKLAEFWYLVHQRDRNVTVSKAVLVDGGLSPPPSKIYPGTKCYMVTVTVDGKRRIGFGPSPSIAQHSAILEACRYLKSCEMEHLAPDTGVPHPQKASPSQHCRNDHVVNMMFDVAKKKEVELNFDVIFYTTEVSFLHGSLPLVLVLSTCRSLRL